MIILHRVIQAKCSRALSWNHRVFCLMLLHSFFLPCSENHFFHIHCKNGKPSLMSKDASANATITTNSFENKGKNSFETNKAYRRKHHLILPRWRRRLRSSRWPALHFRWRCLSMDWPASNSPTRGSPKYRNSSKWEIREGSPTYAMGKFWMMDGWIVGDGQMKGEWWVRYGLLMASWMNDV